MFGSFDLVDILISLPAVFLAFSFHEFAHAFTAYRMGDSTPKFQGRLTLDPFAHVDWIGLIMFAVFGFGWAKPVETNPSKFRNRKWGDIIVSLAGPLANLLLATITMIILQLLRLYFPAMLFQPPNSGLGILNRVMDKIIWLNIVFTFLNLVPIPPFDGYRIIKNLLFRKNAKFFWTLERYSIFILFAFIILDVFKYIISVPSVYMYIWLYKVGTWLGSIL